MLMKILFALIALTVIVPVALYYKSGKTKGKECLLMNAISFFSILGVGGSNSSSMSSVFKDYKARLARFRKLVW